MRAKNLLFIISCFSLQAYSAVPVNSFEQLIDMSCKAHDMTANVRLQLDAARQRVENAEFNKWVPEVTVGVDVYAAKGQPTSFFAVQEGTVQDPEQPNFYSKGEAWQGKVDMNWGLYEDGKWLGESALANAEAESQLSVAKSQLSTAHREALTLVSQYYFNIMMFSAQRDVLQPLVAKRQQQLDEMKTKVEAGVSTTDDLFTASAAYASLKDQLDDAIRQREVNYQFLLLMLQRDVELLNAQPQQSFKELATITERRLQMTDLDSLVSANPDITLLESKLALEKDKLDAQYGKLKPSLGLYVKLRTGDNFGSALRKDYSEIGLTIEYPLGAVASNYGESKALRKTVTAIDSELDYLRKIKRLQAANIAGDLASSKSKIEVARLELTRREQMLSSENERVASGLSGLDELVQAEDDKITAQLNLLTAYNQAWMQYAEASLFSNQICQPE